MIVEDEIIISRELEASIIKMGHEVIATTGKGEEAIVKADSHRPDIILMDIILNGKMDGIKAAEIIRSRFDIPIVFLTAHMDKSRLERAKLTMPFGYLLKPVRERDLKITLEFAIYSAAVDTKRKQAEEELRKSERKFQDLYDNNPDMFASSDIETSSITECNQTLVDTTGYMKDELIGRSIFDLYTPESAGFVREKVFATLMKTGKTTEEGLTIKKKDGGTIDVSLNVSTVRDSQGNIVYSRSSWRDISQRKRLEKERLEMEQQLFQAQKMESLGTLAGGIAHDFNNLLFQILGFTQLAINTLSPDHELRRLLLPVENASNKASALVKQIIGFSRGTVSEFKPLAVQPIIKEILKLLRSSIPTTIEIRQTISENCGPILTDVIKIYQVVMNLCTNAYHAMQRKGGILEVTLDEVEVANESLPAFSGLKTGKYLKLAVRDDGDGMDEAIMAKIFDPLFTTKSEREGTGLGLCIVKKIVDEHKGFISVESTPGKGSTFTIYLPRASITQAPAIESVFRSESFGTEKIMVVDDEHSIVAMEQESLGEMGYQVTGFVNSSDALKAFRDNPQDYDLVITDQTMPEITGSELATQLLTIRQDIPIILLTGHSDIITEEDALKMGIKKFRLKPLDIDELAGFIREILDTQI